MSVLVFGRTGQVATELARRLPGAGFPEAAFLGRDAADLTDPAACAAAIEAAPAGLAAVINAAAYTAVDRAEDEEATAALVNAEAPAAMARACAARAVPFVHVSTDYVFDGRGEAPFAPGDPTGPLGAYGRTKRAGEEGVRGAGGDHAILRTSWVFSAHGGNFAKTMLRLGAERDRLTIVADQVGGPTPAAAIAEALVAIADALARGAVPEEARRGTWHFAGAPAVSWAGFARAIMAAAGLDCAVEDIPSADYPTPAARPANSRLDMSATTATFGIAPPDWRAGLDAVLAELAAAR